MEEEICKWSKKDPVTLLNSMAYPENLQAIEKGQAGLPTRKDDENYQTPPSSPIKDATAAIARHYDELEHIKEEPLESYDLELMNELAAHGHHWSTESGDLHIDLISNSSIVSSPVTVQSSPAPHTPSHSAYKSSTPTMYQGTFYASSPLRIITGSPSVRMNLFGVVTPPRTLSAQN